MVLFRVHLDEGIINIPTIDGGNSKVRKDSCLHYSHIKVSNQGPESLTCLRKCTYAYFGAISYVVCKYMFFGKHKGHLRSTYAKK